MWALQVLSLLVCISSIKSINIYYGPPKEAILPERPFQAAIFRNNLYKCSGTLISKNCIITACSCIVDKEVNNYTLVTYTKYIRAQQINWEYASDIFIHEGCDTSTNENDAAIICSREDLVGYPATIVKERTKENVRAIVSGWGLSVEGQEAIQARLQRAYMRVISLEECRHRYAGVREVPDSALCAVATDEVRGFCGGDIGGPLTHGEGLIGIVVSEFGCERLQPGIFTNVSRISNFIDNTVKNYETQLEIHN